MVWSEVPLAIFVNAQADSNWSIVLSLWPRNSTSLQRKKVVGHQTCTLCLGLNPHNKKRVNLGKIPRLIITSMGGFRSLLRIFLADCVAYRRHLQFLLQNQSIKKQQEEDQPEAACNHLGSEFHSVFPQLRAAETACSPAGG